MTEIRTSVYSIQQNSWPSNIRTFQLDLPQGVNAEYVYACIHDTGDGGTGSARIHTEVLIMPTNQGVFVLRIDLSSVGQGRAFQIRAYQKLEDGTSKEVARLVGPSQTLLALRETFSLSTLST